MLNDWNLLYLCAMNLLIDQLSVGYGKHIIQSALCLSARAGEMVCLLGTNGCGKSTLLRTVAGLQPPVSGSISVCGQSLSSLSAQERSRLLSLVLTERLALENTLVVDIVSMGRYPYADLLGGLSRKDDSVVWQVMEQTDLLPLRNRCFNSLSDGEKQRVLLAKALAQQTPVILLDEPTAHLDLPGRVRTFTLLQKMAHEQQKTVLVSTHDLDIALQMADTLWLMAPCKGVIVGSPAGLLQTSVFIDLFGQEVAPLLKRL